MSRMSCTLLKKLLLLSRLMAICLVDKSLIVVLFVVNILNSRLKFFYVVLLRLEEHPREDKQH